jgi:uncharacterized membrane protein (DUF4010 family)
MAMVVRNGFLLVILDTSFQLIGLYLLPIVIIIVISLFRVIVEDRSEDQPDEQMFDTKLVSPFEFGAALRFAAIFAMVYLVQLVLTESFSDAGVIVAAIIGGFVSAGAVVASSATLFVTGEVTIAVATNAVIIATAMSVLNKMFYVYMADRETKLLKKVARDAVIIGGVLLFYLLLLSLGLLG